MDCHAPPFGKLRDLGLTMTHDRNVYNAADDCT